MAAQSLNFNDIKNSCLNLTNLANSFEETINVTTSSANKIQNPAWEGEAATNYREKLTKLLENLPKAKQQLALSVLFLTSCSNGYAALGEDNVKKLKDLVGGQSYIDSYDVNSAPTVDLNSRYGEVANAAANAIDTSQINNQNNDDSGLNNNNNYNGNSYRGGDNGDSYYGSGSSTGKEVSSLISQAATISSLTGLITTAMTNKESEIPTDLIQTGYAASGYDYSFATGEPVTWEEGTKQKQVSDTWKKQGAVFKNGIAVINVEGVDRYLVSVSSKYGEPGDCIDVKLSDGTVLECIIADNNSNDWGVKYNNKTSILEFKVQKDYYTKNGVPTTSTWNLEWDSNTLVNNIKNTGSIIGAKEASKESFTGATTTSSNSSNNTSAYDQAVASGAKSEDIITKIKF